MKFFFIKAVFFLILVDEVIIIIIRGFRIEFFVGDSNRGREGIWEEGTGPEGAEEAEGVGDRGRGHSLGLLCEGQRGKLKT